MKKILSNRFILLGLAFLIFVVGRYLYMKPKFIRGEIAPNFSAQTKEGDPFQLSDLRGKYVLLDFWGSWCAPCRVENPELVRFYRKFNTADFKDAAGFEVVSVGIEKNASRWEKAIQKDGLMWPYHILDQADNLRFFNSEIANKFGVREVPSKYLINPKGIIIGSNLSLGEMENLLNKRLTTN